MNLHSNLVLLKVCPANVVPDIGYDLHSNLVLLKVELKVKI